MSKDKPQGDTPDLSEEEDKLLDAVWDRLAKEEAAAKKDGKKDGE